MINPGIGSRDRKPYPERFPGVLSGSKPTGGFYERSYYYHQRIS